MRWTATFIPTLRDAPADAEAISHQLLVRGGFIRQLHSGHYSLLPLGLKVHSKVADIVRQEMNAIGAQEFHLPAMHPAELWQRSGRWELMGAEMFRLQDRSNRDLVLAMTHEEAMAALALELNSYKELPQSWYQIQFKFRDEPRPKSGLLRVREFAMKDSYSFDIDEAGLDKSFDAHYDAYVKIFHRLGLAAIPVDASSGAMGGSGSVEFMVPSPAGEDDVAVCTSPQCDYRANVELAQSQLVPAGQVSPGQAAPGQTAPEQAPPATAAELERFATPGVRTIEDLEQFSPAASAHNQIKTLVLIAAEAPLLVLMRGDHQLNLVKLLDHLNQSGHTVNQSGDTVNQSDHTVITELRPAESDEVVKLLGAQPGSLGAVGVSDLRIIADQALQGRTNLVTGANEDDFHLSGVSIERDIAVSGWADLRTVTNGEPCVRCGAALQVIRCIEVGHIFKLGRKYCEALGVAVLDENGKEITPIMGSYGIGIGRAMAAVAETHNDDRGLIWPVSIAPFEVLVTLLDPDDDELARTAETIADELTAAGIDVLLDDRSARPGVKFADAELVGIPYRITVGARSMKNNQVEYQPRSSGESQLLPYAEAAATATAAVQAAAVHTTTAITQSH